MRAVYTEMGDKSKADIQAVCGYAGYYLKTSLLLKGRGIKSSYDDINGTKTYFATRAALKKLEIDYSVDYISYL